MASTTRAASTTPQGNVRSWWTPEDQKKFDERTDCEVKEYGGFEVAPGQKLNGRLTLGENTADNGGLRIAYAALMSTLAEENKSTTEKIDGYTPAQRYFISLRTGLVREHPRAGARGCAPRPIRTRSGRVARQRHRAELRRVRQGVWLQGGPADDAGEDLPRLVNRAYVSTEGPGFGLGLFCLRKTEVASSNRIDHVTEDFGKECVAGSGIKSPQLLQLARGIVSLQSCSRQKVVEIDHWRG